MIVSTINDELSQRESKECFKISLLRNKISLLDYHESNLSLIAREITQLPVNHQHITFPIRPKSISLAQSLYESFQAITVTPLYCLLFLMSKNQRPKTSLKKCYQCSVYLKCLCTSKFVFP